MAKSVVIYSTPACPYCKMAKAFFKQNNVPYKDVDVASDDAAAQEMIRKSGQMGVPVIEIDGELIIGFDKPALQKALGLS